MSRSPETSTRTTSAHRAHREARDRAAARTLAQRPPARYEPYLDGLFTYCLSVLCDHDTATGALGDVLALAERRGQRGPEAPADRRAWLYALARWSCLRRLAEVKQKRHGAHASGRSEGARASKRSQGADASRRSLGADAMGRAQSAHAEGRPQGPYVDGRPQGPYADGRSPGAYVDGRSPGRHPEGQAQGARGGAHRASLVAADRSGDCTGDRTADPTGDLLAAVEEDRRCRELALLAWPEAAGTTPEQREALELAVRHQLAAPEVAAVLGMDPAAARDLLAMAACEVERTRAALAVVETGTCPGVLRLTGDNNLVLSTALRRELVRHVDDCPHCRRTAERAVPGSWPGTSVTPAALPVLEAPRAALHRAMTHVPRARGGGPRFDRRGFPMDPKDHAARRDRLRARAVTTTVVATVVAAPVLALWAAYRGAPLIGEGADGRPVTASEAHGPDGGLPGYENAGNADTGPDPRLTPGNDTPDVSVEVIGVAAGQRGSGLSVAADSSGDTTLITLRASGSSPVLWSVHTGATWLYPSQSSGTLAPDESLTIKVYVDHLREPNGPWSASVSVAPAGAVVTIDGYGTAGPSPTRPGPRPDPPKPSDPGPGPGPTRSGQTPSDPGPEPTPSEPVPSDPEPEPPSGEPTPSGSGGSEPASSDSGTFSDSGAPSPSKG